jgi:O-antigen/teichoic acid export membrane protein
MPTPPGPATRQALAQGLARAVQLAFVLVATGLVARAATPATLGRFSLVVLLAALGPPLSELGLNRVGARRLVLGDATVTPGRLVGLRLAGLLPFAAAGLVAAGVAARSGAHETAVALTFGTTAAVLGSIADAWTAPLQAAGRLHVAATADIASRFAGLGVIAAATAVGVSTGWLLASPVVVPLLDLAVMTVVAARAGWLRPARTPAATTRDITREAAPLGALNVVGLLNAKLDSVLVAGIVGIASFGAYSVALRVFDLLLVAPTVVTLVVFPALVRTHADDVRRYLHYTRAVGALMVDVSITASVCAVLAAPTIVHVVGGDGFSSAVLPTRLLAVAGVGAFLTAWLAQLMVVQQLQTRTLVVAAVMLAVNLVATGLLTWRYHLTGAALGTLLVEIAGTTALIRTLERDLPLRIAMLLLRPTPLIAAACCAVGLVVESAGIDDAVVATIALLICAGGWLASGSARPIGASHPAAAPGESGDAKVVPCASS